VREARTGWASYSNCVVYRPKEGIDEGVGAGVESGPLQQLRQLGNDGGDAGPSRLSARKAAEKLNADGAPTPVGGKWHATQVIRARERWSLRA
jgi:hypothetical protein